MEISIQMIKIRIEKMKKEKMNKEEIYKWILLLEKLVDIDRKLQQIKL